MNKRLIYRILVSLICLTCFFTYLFAGDTNVDPKSGSTTISINEVYLQKWDKEHPNKKELDKKIYKIDSFSRLKQGQTQFAYYILDEPLVNQVYKTYLIYEYYESEMAVWLVNYSLENQVIDFLEVFYDNAEGAWQTTATLNIKTNVIQLKEYDAYAEPEMITKEYKILPSGKIEKVNK